MTVGIAVPTRAADQVPFKASFDGFTISTSPTSDPAVLEIVVRAQDTRRIWGRSTK